MCCGGGSCGGIPGGRDTTAEGAVGGCGRNTRFEPLPIIAGIG